MKWKKRKANIAKKIIFRYDLKIIKDKNKIKIFIFIL